jgi:cysteinyl-tRNA synthetase
MTIRLQNSLTRRLEEFTPIRPGEVRMYTCGPTVYNFAHIGNFRAYMFEDLLRRTLKYAGHAVTQVMNLTDVDDKTIRGSRESGVPLADYTQRFKDAFFADLATLRIERAEQYPAATDHIPEMITIIGLLLDKGYAYRGDDGSVYFSIAKFANYGKLAHIDLAGQRPGARVKNDEYAKDAVADFALWKAWDEADGDVAWDSPWGRGRPGWHIECSAMSTKYLGPHFDIHTGGIDNMFPHHEDEIAQSEAAFGETYVNYWLHCGYLVVDGEKMAKSLGNFYTLRDLVEKGHGPREIRWVLLGTHYRKQLNFSFDAIAQARTVLQSFRDLFDRLRTVTGEGTPSPAMTSLLQEIAAEFTGALYDDLNIAGATAALFRLQREANRRLDAGELSPADAAAVLARFRDLDRIYGVLDVDDCELRIPADVQALADQRQAARKARDFAASDALRGQLLALGWVVEDTPAGPKLKPR